MAAAAHSQSTTEAHLTGRSLCWVGRSMFLDPGGFVWICRPSTSWLCSSLLGALDQNDARFGASPMPLVFVIGDCEDTAQQR